MSPEFIYLNDDRLLIKVDAIVAVTELGENDIDVRTGRLALGIPEGSVAVIHTNAGQTFYVKTEHDEIVTVLQTLAVPHA